MQQPTVRRRSDFVDSENLCDHCTAKCCHYFALPIETPKCRRDFDFMRWYLLHEGATLFVEGDTWYLLVYSTCKHLRDDHRCGIYHTRPQICRDYTTDECEFEDDWTYEKYFETAEQIDEYADAVFGPSELSSAGRGSTRDVSANRYGIRSRRPTSLPVL